MIEMMGKEKRKQRPAGFWDRAASYAFALWLFVFLLCLMIVLLYWIT